MRPELVLLNNFHLDTGILPGYIRSIKRAGSTPQGFKCRIFMAQWKDLPKD